MKILIKMIDNKTTHFVFHLPHAILDYASHQLLFKYHQTRMSTLLDYVSPETFFLFSLVHPRVEKHQIPHAFRSKFLVEVFQCLLGQDYNFHYYSFQSTRQHRFFQYHRFSSKLISLNRRHKFGGPVR